MKKYAIRINGNMTVIEATSLEDAQETAIRWATEDIVVTEATQEDIDWYEGFIGGNDDMR